MYNSRTNLDQPDEDLVQELIEADLRLKEQFGISTDKKSLLFRAAKEIQRLKGILDG